MGIGEIYLKNSSKRGVNGQFQAKTPKSIIIIIYFKSGNKAHKTIDRGQTGIHRIYTIKTVKTHSRLKLKVTQVHNNVIETHTSQYVQNY